MAGGVYRVRPRIARPGYAHPILCPTGALFPLRKPRDHGSPKCCREPRYGQEIQLPSHAVSHPHTSHIRGRVHHLLQRGTRQRLVRQEGEADPLPGGYHRRVLGPQGYVLAERLGHGCEKPAPAVQTVWHIRLAAWDGDLADIPPPLRPHMLRLLPSDRVSYLPHTLPHLPQPRGVDQEHAVPQKRSEVRAGDHSQQADRPARAAPHEGEPLLQRQHPADVHQRHSRVHHPGDAVFRNAHGGGGLWIPVRDHLLHDDGFDCERIQSAAVRQSDVPGARLQL